MKIYLSVILLLVLCFFGCKRKEYFCPKSVQVSDCNLDGEEFIEVLCSKNHIDANNFYRIECPNCPSGRYISYGDEKAGGGAYIERNPKGTELYLFYVVANGVDDAPAGTYCGQCGYQIGSDWTIFEIDPNCFYYEITEAVTITDINQLEKYKVYYLDFIERKIKPIEEPQIERGAYASSAMAEWEFDSLYAVNKRLHNVEKELKERKDEPIADQNLMLQVLDSRLGRLEKWHMERCHEEETEP